MLMMIRINSSVLSIAVAIVLLVSCAQTPKQIAYFVESPEPMSELLWPDLPEIPRYRYAGQLLGEENFVEPEGDEPGALTSMWKWIAGIGDETEQPDRSLVRPQSGVVSGSRIYVTDVGRGAVFVFDKSNGELLIWKKADGGGQLISPIGITAGSGQTILVADSELKRIVRYSSSGDAIGSFGEGVLSRPTGLVRDAGSKRTYVVDTRSHDIKVFDDTGDLLDVIGHRGTGPGEFNAPTHIALNDNRLFVTDTLNARVQVLDLDGDPLSVIGKRGLYIGNLTRPKGVTIDADGNVYVVESYYDHLLVFNQQGEFLLPIGGTGNEIGRFFLPSGVWTDDSGRVYVADMYNARVMILQFLGG